MPPSTRKVTRAANTVANIILCSVPKGEEYAAVIRCTDVAVKDAVKDKMREFKELMSPGSLLWSLCTDLIWAMVKNRLVH